MPDAFISYSHADEAFVVKFDEFLRAVGVSTWFDRRALRPGQKWEIVIEDVIPASAVFISCLSAAGLDRRGYFQVEQQLASKAALRVPSDQLFVLPVLLGECQIPREFRQYHTVNLVDAGAIESLLQSLSDALERPISCEPAAAEHLRDALVAHLGIEAAPNVAYEKLFANTADISFQDSAGLIERIANSRDPRRLEILLRLRGVADISYAEQKALDTAIANVRAGRVTTKLQQAATDDERAAIAKMGFPGNQIITMQIQANKYVRFIARKNTAAYNQANEKIRELMEEGYFGDE